MARDSSPYVDRLRKSDWLIGDVPIHTARKIVTAFHYAKGASNTATALHGLYRKADFQICGVAWLPPTRSCAESVSSDWQSVLSLSRLVICPDVPKNAATFLLMASIKRLDARWTHLLTYADTSEGHTGEIYRLTGWEYKGLTKPERRFELDGRMISRKSGPVTRTTTEMAELGAVCTGSFSKHKFVMVRHKRPVRRYGEQLEIFAARKSASTGKP
jgi:hypothetical protein